MPQYCVGYSLNGSVTVKAKDRDEAMAKVQAMSTEKLADKVNDLNIEYVEELDKE